MFSFGIKTLSLLPLDFILKFQIILTKNVSIIKNNSKAKTHKNTMNNDTIKNKTTSC